MQNSKAGRFNSKRLKFTTRTTHLAAVIIAILAIVEKSEAYSFEPHFLDRGDEAVLVAPRANFELELKRLNLGSSKFEAVQGTNDDYASEAADGEAGDLAAALKKAKASPGDAARIQKAHEAARAALREFRQAVELWSQQHQHEKDVSGDDRSGTVLSPPPLVPSLALPSDLPAEFADYLEGDAANAADLADQPRRTTAANSRQDDLRHNWRFCHNRLWGCVLLAATVLGSAKGAAARGRYGSRYNGVRASHGLSWCPK